MLAAASQDNLAQRVVFYCSRRLVYPYLTLKTLGDRRMVFPQGRNQSTIMRITFLQLSIFPET
jgi:hypothetical protein